MTIIDPPIKDNSSLYKDKLYKSNIVEFSDSNSVINDKDNSETTTYVDEESIDPYSIKVNSIILTSIFKTYLTDRLVE